MLCIEVVLIIAHLSFFFFFNDTATTEIYTLSLHDALPISPGRRRGPGRRRRAAARRGGDRRRSEEHTSELQSQSNLVCRLLLEKKKKKKAERIIQLELSYGDRPHSTVSACI